MIEFLEEFPLSNGITFKFDELNTLEDIKIVRNSIIEEEIQNFEAPNNWSIDTLNDNDILNIDEILEETIKFVNKDRLTLH